MKGSNYKTVLMAIEVPEGDYCWNRSSFQAPICESFTNEGGHSRCIRDFQVIEDKQTGAVLKSNTCKNLRSVK